MRLLEINVGSLVAFGLVVGVVTWVLGVVSLKVARRMRHLEKRR